MFRSVMVRSAEEEPECVVERELAMTVDFDPLDTMRPMAPRKVGLVSARLRLGLRG